MDVLFAHHKQHHDSRPGPGPMRTDKASARPTNAALRRWRGTATIVDRPRPPRNVPDVLPAEIGEQPHRLQHAQTIVIQRSHLRQPHSLPPTCASCWNGPHSTCRTGTSVWKSMTDFTSTGTSPSPALSGCRSDGPVRVARLQDALLLSRRAPRDRPAAGLLPPTARALVTPSSAWCNSVCRGAPTRAHALAYLVGRDARSLDDVVTIGDDINDVEMVRCSGLGIAVDNALPEVKGRRHLDYGRCQRRRRGPGHRAAAGDRRHRPRIDRIVPTSFLQRYDADGTVPMTKQEPSPMQPTGWPRCATICAASLLALARHPGRIPALARIAVRTWRRLAAAADHANGLDRPLFAASLVIARPGADLPPSRRVLECGGAHRCRTAAAGADGSDPLCAAKGSRTGTRSSTARQAA